jgi:hypothetical protein
VPADALVEAQAAAARVENILVGARPDHVQLGAGGPLPDLVERVEQLAQPLLLGDPPDEHERPDRVTSSPLQEPRLERGHVEE